MKQILDIEFIKMENNWIKTNLENCVDILDGKRVPVNSKERQKRKGEIPYYGATGQTGWIDDYLFDEELVLVGEDGAPFFDIHKDTAYIISGKSWVNNHAHVIRGIDKILLNKFLSYYLNIFDYHGYVSGTTRLKLNQSSLRKIPVLIPPYNEQKRIVAKIEELFSKIDSTKESLEHTKPQLKQFRQSLLKSAFTGKLTEKWRNKNKIISSIELKKNLENESDSNLETIINLKEYELLKIPKEWLWINVGHVTGSMKNGIYKPKNFYNDNGIACLRMYNIDNWKIIWIKIKRMNLSQNEITEYELKVKDILVNRVNSKELVGKSAVIEEDLEKCVFESKNIRLRLKSFMNPWFVNFWFQIFSQRYYSKNLQQTVGMASINQDQVTNMPIPITSLEEQNEIVSIIKQNFSLIETTKNITNSMIQQLDTLQSSILKQAFEGKLVPQDPKDEPVTVILEKIKNLEKAKSTNKF